MLLTLLVALVVGLEGAARFVMPRKSVGITRITHDLADMRTLTAPVRDGRPTVLFVGNSLLLDGIDRAQLVSLTKDVADVHLFPAEGTMFIDWKYGLRKLFQSGTRPALVVLCVNAEQLTSLGSNGATFAHFMMPLRDFPALVHETDLAPMAASEYLLAHGSYWLATRDNVRMGVMERLVPGAKELVPHLTLRGKQGSSDPEGAARLIVDRLNELQQLAADNGAKFAWLIPPTENDVDLAPLAAPRATAAGVTVMFPYRPGEMPSANYADGFHLNHQGAELLTVRVAESLNAYVQKNLPGKPRDSAGQ
ncbi:MAG TPA: hypothetical protein VM146_10035 [Steroidobacteraceae bacterium]|nr:hypothetical protein [Steroidobacteraceae bacterium]